MRERKIVIFGNLSDGFTFLGPFQDFEEAHAYCIKSKLSDTWIATLDTPED